MSDMFESSNEVKHVEKDLEDRIRHEIAWQIGRYMRRIKEDALEFGRDELRRRGAENVNMISLAEEAVTNASGGMFLPSPRRALEVSAPDS